MPDTAPDAPLDLAAAVARRLAEVGAASGPVTDLRRLTGGATHDTWALRAGDRDLILRRERPGPGLSGGVALEAAAIRAADAAGVPVPVVVDVGGIDGVPHLVSERLAGETIPRKLLRDDAFAAVRPGLARRFGEILARLHTVAPADVPGLPDGDPLDDLVAVHDALGDPRPAVELALRWLRAHRPPAVAPTLVHGDFRTGNVVVDPTGLVGVLDWELTHAGDPAEDLGWLCVRAWRFGGPGPVGGFGSREELLAGYAAAGGTPPSAASLHWWEVYGTLRWTVFCRIQAERFHSGADPSLEMAALGRRVAEQEHDLLRVLGLAGPETVTDPLPAPELRAGSAPHDGPAADALLETVAATLDGLAPDDPGQRFHLRVASSVLRVARRELHLGPTHREAHRARLDALGCADDAALARAIRSADDDPSPAVVEAVRASVRERVLVGNPRHLT